MKKIINGYHQHDGTVALTVASVSDLSSTRVERSWFECLSGTLYYAVFLGKTLVLLSM